MCDRIDKAGAAFVATVLAIIAIMVAVLFAREAGANDDEATRYQACIASGGNYVQHDQRWGPDFGELLPTGEWHCDPPITSESDPYTKPAVVSYADWRYESSEVDVWCGIPDVENTMQRMIVTLYPSAGSDYDLCVWETNPDWRADPKYRDCFAAVLSDLLDEPVPDGYVDGSGRSSDQTDTVDLPMGVAGQMLCVDRYDWGFSGSWVLEASLMPMMGGGSD